MPSLNRVKMMKASRAMIRALGPEGLHVAEISGKWGQQFGFGRYERFHFPKHDNFVPDESIHLDARHA